MTDAYRPHLGGHDPNAARRAEQAAAPDIRGADAPLPNRDLTPDEQLFKMRFGDQMAAIEEFISRLEGYGMAQVRIEEGDWGGLETGYRVVGRVQHGPGKGETQYTSEAHTTPMAALAEAGRWLFDQIQIGNVPDPNKAPAQSTILGADGQPLQ